jgi:RNA polymerase-binding transcription factor DksA
MDRIKASLFQDKLQRRKMVVTATLHRLENEQKEAVANNDWLDLATHESRSELLDRLADWYLQEKAQIDGALARIYGEDYGTCRACHRPIEQGRLDTFPETEFCWACQDVRERFERI